ncbi:MAG: NAD(P)H-dependent oxidoreductase subunit E, partial [Thermoflexales bacterium]|nr:NAD(P)H-dependent oxidoreductase subunit E [Thermoflexales bacterium]
MLREKRAAEIEAVLAKYPPERKRSAIMPLLYMAQEEYGYCSPEAMREVADILGLDPTEVKSIVGFYTMFYEKPVGKYVIDVCDDLPCALRGADKFVSHCERRLGIRVGQTTPDGLFTLNTVMCIAACDRAPVAQVNREYHYDLTEQAFDQLV